MASWDDEKDILVQKFKQKTFGFTRLRVTANSYNDGEPKIQVARQRRKDEDADWVFTKLGRLDYAEAKWLGKILRKQVTPWFEEYFAKHGTGKSKKKNK